MPFILKYEPYILKYMARIFYNFPCIFYKIPFEGKNHYFLRIYPQNIQLL